MWCEKLTLVVLCVWASVVLCCASRRAKIDKETFRSQGPSSNVGERSPIRFIYPRTGRLFHADYVRDNEIFKSLERNNFMTRGPFAESVSLEKQRKTRGAENNFKRHVYFTDIKEEKGKKDNLMERKNNLPKAVLFKVSRVVVKDPVIERRSKRDTIPDDVYKTITEETMISVKKSADLSENKKVYDILNNSSHSQSGMSNEEVMINVNENRVDCNNTSSGQNNDTDKTLFVHDSTQSEIVVDAPSVKVPTTLGVVDSGGLMKRTVLDDSLRLYPVYRGVKYYYPQTERRLVYSPQLTVQMDLPVVTEAEDEGNSTTELRDEGRSRRPFKKLAFPLLLALKLKTAIMVPLILGFIGLISFKGLWSGLTALAIAAALGLKALVAGGGAKVLVHQLPPPPPPAHVHHLPPPAVEYAEYWSRRNDDHHNNYYSDYRPSSWT